MAQFNWLDYIVLAVFFLSIFMGLIRGLVSEVVSIITLIAAFLIATMFADTLSIAIINYSAVQDFIAKTSTSFGGNTAEAISYIALGISFLLLFAGTILVGVIVKFFLNLAFTTGLLGIGNRLLGGMFGVARGFILNLVLLFLIQLTPLNNQDWWKQSYFVNIYQPAIQWLDARVTPAIAQLKDKLENSNINAKIQNLISSSPIH